MSQEEEEMVELLAWAKQGIHECFRTTRGARMFGAHAMVRAVSNSALEIKTHSRDTLEPRTWRLELK